jgi:GNAT superfamily N-acetyltransferase
MTSIIDRPYLTDHSLARRLERAEATSNAAFVEARARLQPDSDASWIDVGGTYAMFDGADSPVTQTFGLGLFSDASHEDLAALERFFLQRESPVFHEVSPIADPALLPMLVERHYNPIELTSVMHRPITSDDALDTSASTIRARLIEPGEESVWADTAARGWSASPELTDFMHHFVSISAQSRGSRCFIAERDGVPMAAAALAVHEGVALLAGASTRPEYRGQGAQAALVRERLRRAAEEGCELAMMGARPGSASQRNAERNGFLIAYTRIKWQQRSGGDT